MNPQIHSTVRAYIVLCLAALFVAAPVAADFDPSPVRVNQIGYLLGGTKIGVVVDAATTPLTWEVRDAATNALVLAGQTTVFGDDPASGDHLHHADFTALNALGTYKLVAGGNESVPFEVAPNLYTDLPREAMNYFYFHRMGMDVEKAHLQDDRFDHPALHPGDVSIPPYDGWCATCANFDVFGSWADAGDFGIYAVNHAIAAWTLMNLLEMFPSAFADGALSIPESGNGVNDLLDEVDWGSRFMRGLLPSDGGLASHKVHNHAWSPFTITISGENAMDRSAMASSTNATYAVARNSAQLARLWAAYDAAYADQLWAVAEDAWSRADGTDKPYDPSAASPGSAVGGGDYGDAATADDRYAAAVEMYLTAFNLGKPGAATYKSAIEASPFYKQMAHWDWAQVDGAATLSLYAVANDLSAADRTDVENAIVSFADGVVAVTEGEGYPVNIDGNPISAQAVYPWGSNSFVLNRAIALAYAYEITGDVLYQKHVLKAMDYMMGVNAMRLAYVTGYGEFSETDTHDRWAWTVSGGAFWPVGWLAGGPNDELINDNATPRNQPPAKSYAGPGTAPDAWGSKENTINWNSPLAWVAWYVEHRIVPVLGGCVGNCPPEAFDQSVTVEMNEATAITLTAFDVDGTIAAWDVGSPSHGVLAGAAPNLTYTPDDLYLGADSFTFTVDDDQGATSDVATVSILVRQCDYLDIFDVPSLSPFPDTSSVTYSFVHVSEEGPNLSNVTSHVTKYDLGGDAINQFSLATDDGNPDFFNDLRACMPSETFGDPNPGFTLDQCGFNGLDGDYWIHKIGADEVWVEKSNGWAVYYSNEANPPEFCRTSPECTVSAECDDGLFCTGVETCANNGCQLGTDPCPGAFCDEAADQCVACVPDGGGQPCTASTNCCSGVGNCTGGNPANRLCASGGGISPVCGNGVRESGEDCDGADLGGESCQSLGFTSGTLACDAGCSFDTSGCSGGTCVSAGEGAPCGATTNCCSGVGNCTGGRPANRVCN